MVMYGSSIFFIEKTERLVSARAAVAGAVPRTGSFVVAGGMSAGGALTALVPRQLSPEEVAAERAGGTSAYAALSRLADQSPPGAHGLIALPYFAGERTPLNDPLARGMFAGLTLTHTRADLYRALLEAVGYGIRHNIETMSAAGVPPRRILAIGGGVLNRPWMQTVSDIVGLPQTIPQGHFGACYGDTFLAGVGVGVFAGIAEAERWLSGRQVVAPRPEYRELYDTAYGIFRRLYEESAGASHELARWSGDGDG